MDPETRAALDGHQAGAVRWVAGGVIAVVLGVLLGVATVAIVGNTGRRYPGVGIVSVVLVVAGLIAVSAGAGALVRTARWRRALNRTAWQYGRLRIAGPAIIAFEPAGFDELDPFDEPVRLKLLSTAVWRTRAVQGLDGSEVRAALVGPRRWVITADGLGTLYGAGEVDPPR